MYKTFVLYSMKKTFLWIVLMLLYASRVFAVPAFPELISFQQPNSKITFDIYLKGDEKVHWAETTDGYSLLHGNDGTLYYAMPDGKGGMKPSSFMATSVGERNAEVIEFLSQTPKYLHFSKEQVRTMQSVWDDLSQMRVQPKSMQNVLGEKKFLVILFAFADQAFTHTKAEFEALFNQVNYTEGHRTGSVRDYYYDVSHGQFTLNVDIVGPYMGDSNVGYYGNNPDYALGYQSFATQAVEFASHEVDFSDYDNDGDGHIDGMHIIFAGHGEEATGNATQIWSHKWNIFSSPVYNNTIVDVYSCSPECGGNFGETLTAIGVICHELGHVFGAPDYYDTDYGESGGQYPGLGAWDIMSGGSWNRNGITPAQHNPYTKIYIYHWATCDTLTQPQMVTMRSVTDCNTDYHRINTSTNGDFFLLENRQQQKWDQQTPGHGMLVYHIHPDAHGASVSNYRHPQQIYIVAPSTDTFPNASPSSYGSIGMAAFPYGSRRDSLTDNSVPWFRPWSKQPNNSPLTYISENNTRKTVSFCFKGALPQSSGLTAVGVSHNKVRLDWVNYGSLKAMIVVSDTNVFGTPRFGRNYSVGDTLQGGGVVVYCNGDNRTFADSLQSSTTYYFRLYTKLNDTTYAPTYVSASATTLACAATEWRSEDFESVADGELPACWTGDWEVNEHDGAKVLEPNTNAPSWDGVYTVYSAPVSFPDSVQNAVLSFHVNFEADSNANLSVLSRASVTGDWHVLQTLTPADCPHDTNTIYISLPEVTAYTFVGFRFNGQSGVRVDNVCLMPGYLVHSTDNGGGEFTPQGHHVYQLGDTVTFTMVPHEHFIFANLYLDGERVTTSVRVVNGVHTYALRVRRSCLLHATFVNRMDIAEPTVADVRVYPNPTSGRLTIENVPASAREMTLYNMQGCAVLRQAVAAGQSAAVLSLQGLPRGIYMLRIGQHVVKVVKQ